jgi:hypothetical protein
MNRGDSGLGTVRLYSLHLYNLAWENYIEPVSEMQTIIELFSKE